ncbi:MAG: glycosyl hydrolase family 28 protein [Muribaculaceae bacterium]|nr:glycosyl hydrolase family 28 protein [Muribaculaceae bacterium]
MRILILSLFVITTLFKISAIEIEANSKAKSPENRSYKIEIKRGNSDWEKLQSHDAIAYWGTIHMSFAKFEDTFANPVKVRITKRSGRFQSVGIRPLSKNITSEKINDNTTEFVLKSPTKISIEFDGDRYNNIFLFAGKEETDIPNKDDENVLWYGAGVHNVGKIILKSNQTLYVHPDALIYGHVYANEATNIKIKGSGIIDGSQENMDFTLPRNSQLLMINCKNVEVKDVMFRNSPTWNIVTVGCDNIHFDGIKQIGSNANSDGFDIVSSSNILIENTFQRNKDDNISIKAIDLKVNSVLDGLRADTIQHLNVKESHDILMRGCSLWADEAHNMLIGPEVNGTKVYNIKFEDIDVLENNQNDDVYPGTMAVMIADKGTYSDIHWKNIRIEDITSGQIISLTYQNAYAVLGYGSKLKNVIFENISYNGFNASPSRILGMNKWQNIENVIIKNYKINGGLVKDNHSGNIKLNEWVKNIKFSK